MAWGDVVTPAPGAGRYITGDSIAAATDALNTAAATGRTGGDAAEAVLRAALPAVLAWPCDTIDDLFPGTGVLGRVVAAAESHPSVMQIELFGDDRAQEQT